jgi:GTP-binding protein Era
VTRSGFVAIAGRPNVGKSTLINALVGAKVAIVSDKPQTTRRAIRGVATGEDWQLVLVDLPGVQRPRDALTQRMQARVERELAEADAALLLLNGEQGVGPGDRFIARALGGAVPVTVAVNKIDRLARAQELETLTAAAQLVPQAEVFPISARTGAGVGPLLAHLVAQLPEGPFMYERAQHGDLDRETLLAELIREQVLRRTFKEIPHAVGVVVEDVDWPRAEDDLATVRALIWVETESQKGILIGAQGKMVKAIGTAARKELERELRARVHLDLAVRVRRRWRADDSLLDRLGIE